MAMRIFTNVSSQIAQNRLDRNNANLAKAIEKIASGKRIQFSFDDVASHAVSEGLHLDARASRQGLRNLEDGLTLLDSVEEGGLSILAGNIVRARELASLASTGTVGASEKKMLQLEFEAIKGEINRITESNEFLGQKLLDGSLASNALGEDVIITTGLDSRTENRINLNESLNLKSTSTTGLGINKLDISTTVGAIEAMEKLQNAETTISNSRARVGAIQQRLIRAIQNLSVNIENLTAAASTIRNADMATELTDLTKQLLLVQSSAAMVGQANLRTEGVLSLLQ
jgi:flagellin